MASGSRLTLAVAGSRKTQSIVEQCAASDPDERILILTYTTINQTEVRSRIAQYAGDHPNIEIMGWFSFLIAHFVRPLVPFTYPGSRVRGFDYDSKYQQGVGVGERRRYFNSHDQVRKVHLSQLATRVDQDSGGLAVQRLEKLYDRIYIDEVQDLCGYDLEILKLLMASKRLELQMVGDVRQATLVTSIEERKNKPYVFMGIWRWFQEQEQAGNLTITQRNVTFRCRPEIAAFADSLFDSRWNFSSTVSQNHTSTGHDGVFLIRSDQVAEYTKKYDPLGLRVSKAVGKDLPLRFMNFGQVKGLGRERVLILPTGPIRDLLMKGKVLNDSQAAALYVAVTRAEQSVGFILDNPGGCNLPVWPPADKSSA